MNSDDTKKLKDRLAKYGLLTVAIAATSESSAAIIYTDETPDFAGGIGSQYFLDLNNDAVNDFRIWHNGSMNLYISPLTASNDALGSGGATFAYPFALSNGATISSGAGNWFNNGYGGGYQSLNYGSCSFGNWCNITDRYIGLRFNIAGSIHYGWVRLDVNFAGSVWTVKDYAYNDVAGAGLNAGDTGGSASQSTTIWGADIADNANGTDLEVTFTAAADESTVSEYRIIAVKSSMVGTFDLAAAEALTGTNYVSVNPSGLIGYVQALNASQLDSDGDPIVLGQPYRIYILNMADGTNATINSLSAAAVDVTLNTTADIATSVAGSDVSDNGNATDLQVDFTAATNESGIGEYRVIAAKTASAGSFDLAAAQALSAGMYEVQAVTGGPYSLTFNASTTDSDGDAIVMGQPYTIFVLSVANGTLANIDDLSSPSSSLTLNFTCEAASGIIGTDIADNGNGLDLQVDFTAPTNETGILAYRVIAVKSSAAGSFTMNNALALPSTAWMFVTATGATSYSVVFESIKTDSDGDLIIENQPYTIFVLSFPDGQSANMAAMTSSSNTVTLISYVGLDEAGLEQVNVFSDGDQITVNLPETLTGTNVQMDLVSTSGQIIKSQLLENAVSTIDVNDVVGGLYFVHIKNDAGEVKAVKVILN